MPTESDNLLAAAIAALYETFGRYQPTTLNQFCHCCWSEGETEFLRERPLREITFEQISRYGWKATTTVGTVIDYKYFLPRICELFARDSYPTNIEVLIGSKLDYMHFPDWPQAERHAVVEFLRALWRSTLSTMPSAVRQFGVLCVVAHARIPLADFLEAWGDLAVNSQTARLQLAEMICSEFADPLDLTAASFWEDHVDAYHQVQNWVLGLRGTDLIMRAFEEWCATDEGRDWDYVWERYASRPSA